jgi:DNA-binding LytR/AlgR family response regulator
MILRTLIVDDEPLARRRIATMLRQIVGVEIVGEAEDGDTALDLVRTLAPDVILLDVKMPGTNGFDLLPLLDGPVVPVVIFVTAFNHYATRAFEVSAVDYLLKPVAFDRMRDAIERARTALISRDAEGRIAEMAAVIAALRDNPPERPAKSAFESEFWVQRRGEFVRVPVARLDWVGAERDYVRLHAEDDVFLLRETMAGMESRLDPALFIRVHRSAVVRRTLVSAIRQAGYGAIKLALVNGVEMPVGRTYATRVRQLLVGRDVEA